MEIKAITLPESRDKDACYDFFFRVYRWWYNHNNDETWRMIGYFGTDRKNGALFMDMVMVKVTQYENRIKEECYEQVV